DQVFRILRCADRQRHGRGAHQAKHDWWRLLEYSVHFRFCAAVQSDLVHVAHYSHNFFPRATIVEPDALADGILVRPVAPGHDLIDDDDGLGGATVALREVAALDQRDSQGPEIGGAHSPIVTSWLPAGRRWRPAFDFERHAGIGSGERQSGGETDGFDAGRG